MIKIAPSLLSADFANMGEATRKLGEWKADLVHFDVMDGTFVPTITFGPAMCAAIRPYTELPIDVHIMVGASGNIYRPVCQGGRRLSYVPCRGRCTCAQNASGNTPRGHEGRRCN